MDYKFYFPSPKFYMLMAAGNLYVNHKFYLLVASGQSLMSSHNSTEVEFPCIGVYCTFQMSQWMGTCSTRPTVMSHGDKEGSYLDSK